MAEACGGADVKVASFRDAPGDSRPNDNASLGADPRQNSLNNSKTGAERPKAARRQPHRARHAPCDDLMARGAMSRNETRNRVFDGNFRGWPAYLAERQRRPGEG